MTNCARLRLIQVPYDSGHKDYRMGRGPGRIARHLGSCSGPRELFVDTVAVDDRVGIEIGGSFQVARELAHKVKMAQAEGEFPLVLAGGCMSCVGTLAGLGAPPPAIIWLDAHGDFNTPETTVTGFLDGMPLAIAVGHCWGELAKSVPGFQAVSESNTLLVGARELDPLERVRVENSALTWIPAQQIRRQGVRKTLEPLFATLQARTQRAYLHIDLDVLDPAEARVNQFAAPEGLSLAELLEVVRVLRQYLPLAAAAVTAYDPEYDEGDKALRAALAVIEELSRQV